MADLPVESAAPDAAYAVVHELRHFVSQARLSTTSDGPDVNTVFAFSSGTYLRTLNEFRVEPPVQNFVTRSAQLTEALALARRLNLGPAGPSVEGVGLERILIAFELANLYEEQSIDDWISGNNVWLRDISHILSFFSQMAQRRYEKSTAQMTVAYYPSSNLSPVAFGLLGKPLLDEYKALLRLCRDAHTVLCVNRDLAITGLRTEGQGVSGPGDSLARAPMPPRLAHLRSLPRDGGVEPIVFNLNTNGSMEILAKSDLAFRRVNNVWRFVTTSGALTAIQAELESVGGHPSTLVAHNFLSLALDLADRGEGALPFLCDEPTTEVLGDLLDSREGLVRALPGLPLQELSARMRFTQLVGGQKLSLATDTYPRLSPLLRDICSIDGATIFSYGGDLLGFGCIVNIAALTRASGTAPRREGARSAAAKAVSRKGVAIKVSTDGDATLFLQGKEWATFC
jgi:hypothetical protein